MTDPIRATAQADYGEFYARHVHNLVWEALFSQAFMDSTFTKLQECLRYAGVMSGLDKMHVMDVGTGRQALGFALLGADRVSHFDISAKGQARFASHVAENYPNLNIASQRRDLCRDSLGAECFDFIYLEGVAQHLADIPAALVNCVNALKPGGRLWLMFYRSGCYESFVVSMIRQLVGLEDLGPFFNFIVGLIAQKPMPVHQFMGLMDDLFVEHRKLFTPFAYLDFMTGLGLEVCGSQRLDPLCAVNHQASADSSVLVLRKNFSGPVTAGPKLADILSGERAVDQLDPAQHEDPRALAALEAFRTNRARLAALPPAQRFDKVRWLYLDAYPELGGFRRSDGRDYQGLIGLLTK